MQINNLEAKIFDYLNSINPSKEKIKGLKKEWSILMMVHYGEGWEKHLYTFESIKERVFS